MGEQFVVEIEPETDTEAILSDIVGEMLTSFHYRDDRGMVSHYLERLRDAGFNVVVEGE